MYENALISSLRKTANRHHTFLLILVFFTHLLGLPTASPYFRALSSCLPEFTVTKIIFLTWEL